MNLEWRKWRIKLKAHYKNFYRGCSDVFIWTECFKFSPLSGPDLPRWRPLPVKTQPDSADSLPNWIFQRMSPRCVIVTQPTGWRVRGNGLATVSERVCVCFIPVAQCLTDRKSFLLTYQNSLCHLSRNKFSPAVRGCRWLSLDLSPLSFFCPGGTNKPVKEAFRTVQVSNCEKTVRSCWSC